MVVKSYKTDKKFSNKRRRVSVTLKKKKNTYIPPITALLGHTDDEMQGFFQHCPCHHLFAFWQALFFCPNDTLSLGAHILGYECATSQVSRIFALLQARE